MTPTPILPGHQLPNIADEWVRVFSHGEAITEDEHSDVPPGCVVARGNPDWPDWALYRVEPLRAVLEETADKYGDSEHGDASLCNAFDDAQAFLGFWYLTTVRQERDLTQHGVDAVMAAAGLRETQSWSPAHTELLVPAYYPEEATIEDDNSIGIYDADDGRVGATWSTGDGWFAVLQLPHGPDRIL